MDHPLGYLLRFPAARRMVADTARGQQLHCRAVLRCWQFGGDLADGRGHAVERVGSPGIARREVAHCSQRTESRRQAVSGCRHLIAWHLFRLRRSDLCTPENTVPECFVQILTAATPSARQRDIACTLEVIAPQFCSEYWR